MPRWLLPFLLALPLGAQPAARWRVQWTPPPDRPFLIADIAFSSPQHGFAVGGQSEAILTDDGGVYWVRVPLEEPGRSIFFLSDARGWMVTEKGVWRTADGGRHWKRLCELAGLVRVHFQDDEHGWAVGSLKSVFETKDGGVTWTEVAAASEPKTRKKFTLYHWVHFVTPRVGVITGASIPERKDGPPSAVPAWLDPSKASRRPEWPTTSIVLETRDGGVTWKASTASIFGRMTRM